jgi:Ca2+/H+ antiporter
MARVDVISLNRVTSVVLIAVYLLYMWTQIASTKYSYKPLVQSDDAYEPDLNDSVELVHSQHHDSFSPRHSAVVSHLRAGQPNRTRELHGFWARA